MTTPVHHHDNRYRLARALLLLNALTWLGLGIAHLLRSTGPNWVLALLLFANAAAFFSAAYLLQPKRSWAFYFTQIILLANILLSVTDQFGWIDALTMMLHLIIFGLLFFTRHLYTQSALDDEP